jgi:phosphoglycolate phosphatase
VLEGHRSQARRRHQGGLTHGTASGAKRIVFVLFDFDGTVVDSSLGIYNGLEFALGEVGAPIPDRSTMSRWIGPPLEVTFAELAPNDADRAVQLYRDRYRRLGITEATLYDGLADALDALIEDGHVLAIATSKIEDVALMMLDYFEITDRFAVIGGARPDLGRLDKAAVVAHVLDQLGDGHAVLVGDRHHDVEGATANGIGCIGARWGFGSDPEFATCLATVAHPSELHGTITALSDSSG